MFISMLDNNPLTYDEKMGHLKILVNGRDKKTKMVGNFLSQGMQSLGRRYKGSLVM